jgi:hypothetical protein
MLLKLIDYNVLILLLFNDVVSTAGITQRRIKSKDENDFE